MDPSPFTLHELVTMYRGQQETQWIHTAHLLVTLVNINRDPKSPPVKFTEVYPFSPKASEERNDAEVLKDLWLAACKGTAGGKD